MRIGLIDVDSHNYPNLPLMKMSAWHKSQGDSVEWYQPLFHNVGDPFDKVYMSKIFSFTQDFQYGINARSIQKGGSGYCISLVDGKEVYDKSKDIPLPYEVEHIYPDYSLYPQYTDDRCYGFLTRGCHRGCEFCIVGTKEGRKSYKVADLDEFWRGQKKIVLNDPNILGYPGHKDLLQQLIDSRAQVEFNQGLDVRFINESNVDMIRKIPMKYIHLAFDKYQEKDVVVPKLKFFKEATGYDHHKVMVYILVNFDSTFEQDLERISICRELDLDPFVMVYDKAHADKKYIRLQRWVNNDFVFWKVPTFDEYLKGGD